jgi:ATP-binding protein involved in chromosome partitioning
MAKAPSPTPGGAPTGGSPIPGVKNVIAVGAGKGGVGKSTLAVNLALALKQNGAQVGLMDLDVYGPSIPKMLANDERPVGNGEGRILPNEAYGLKLMSMGFLLDPNKPMVVRGPIVHSIVRQFLGDVEWGELDYLVVDLPPGTGDVALSLGQSVPLTGAIVISTPQDVALIDVEKAVGMFRTLNVPILGIVENMAWYECPACGDRQELFGPGKVEEWAKSRKIDFLGRIPMHACVALGGDAGRPALADAATSDSVRGAFLDLGVALRAQLDKLASDAGAASGPLIQIEGLS